MATADSVSEKMISEKEVKDRYSAAAKAAEPALCCPVSYNPRYLKAIPEEILTKDYGCGDPSPFVNSGDTVLDLGSGGGKLCYIASQIVGPNGQVIGVDCNSEMLALARKYQSQVAKTIGHANVDFRCGHIQDLGLNLELLAEEMNGRQFSGLNDLLDMREIETRLRNDKPLIDDNSVDCVISNCVLNLVDPNERKQLFREIYRVLKVGGRAAISDIVSDEDVPQAMQNDGTLWSGCISGAWREDRFVEEFREAGFQGMQIAKLEKEPWQTVQGIQFRSMTMVAYKTDTGPCLERNQAVVYRGPFKKVLDDDGHVYVRAQRTAVCDRTFQGLSRPPYHGQFIAIEPRLEIPLEQATEFDCSQDRLRAPSETKGQLYKLTISSNGDGCEGDQCC